MESFKRLSLDDRPDEMMLSELRLDEGDEDVSMGDVSMGDVGDVGMADVGMEDVRMEDVRMEDVRMEDVGMEDVGMEDLSMEDDKNDHSMLYNVIFEPTMQGCRLASGYDGMKRGQGEDLKRSHGDGSGTEEPAEAPMHAPAASVKFSPQNPPEPAERCPAEPITEEPALHPPPSPPPSSPDEYTYLSTSDGISHRNSRQRLLPIFINQNNYIQTYNRYPETSSDHSRPATAGGPAWRKPYYISTYLQVLINSLISFYALYQAYLFLRTIKRDVAVSVENELVDSQYKIADCYRQYHLNRCHEQNLPALQAQCLSWMKCMNKEPYMLINYSELMVSIIGSLTNKFFDSFSIKSFVFLVLVVVGVYAWNFSCGYVRAKSFYGLPLGEDYGGGRSGDYRGDNRAGGSGHREVGNGEDLRGGYIGGSGRNYNGGISGSGRDYGESSGKELTKLD